MLSSKLAPEIRSLLEAMAAQGGPAMETLSAAEARQATHGLDQLAGEAESVSRIETRKIPSRSGELPVRIWWTDSKSSLRAREVDDLFRALVLPTLATIRK